MHVPQLTVLENIVLGQESGLFGDLPSAERRLFQIASDFCQPIDPRALVGSLSVGEQQRVEIYKALYRHAELLILDEATAMLTPREAEQLFEICRTLVARGKSVIFITHKLDEVISLSNRVTVLRHGRNVSTFRTDRTSPNELARLMVGREIPTKITKSIRRPGPAVLEITNLDVSGHRTNIIQHLSLSVHAGEIVGIAGVDGNGQTELVEAICGLRRITRGAILFNGEDIANFRPAAILKKGLACLPADRHSAAVVESFSLEQNALLGFSHTPPFAAHGFIDSAAVLNFAQEIIAQYGVKADSPATSMRNLSGGHQQRFVFGRTLRHDPRLLIAVQPTRGLDIVSSDFVRRELVELRDAGKGVLLVSMDLDEVLVLSDRVEVIHRGQIIGSANEHSSREEIGLMMAGVRPGAPPRLEL
jgi:simple sugar transport system ATP-binding protein